MEDYKNGGDGVFKTDTEIGLLIGGTVEGFNITHD